MLEDGELRFIHIRAGGGGQMEMGSADSCVCLNMFQCRAPLEKAESSEVKREQEGTLMRSEEESTENSSDNSV